MMGNCCGRENEVWRLIARVFYSFTLDPWNLYQEHAIHCAKPTTTCLLYGTWPEEAEAESTLSEG